MNNFRSIEPGRRLLSAAESEQTGMHEYFDPSRSARFIHIPSGSPILEQHRQLAEARLATYSAIYADNGSAELIVPSGSLSIRQALKSIAMDLPAYAEIFNQIGRVIRASEEAGYGALSATVDRPLLRSIAFSPDRKSAYGSAVYLVPPYAFDHSQTVVDDLLVAREEMLESGLFPDKELVIQTLAEVAIGYDSDGRIQN